MSMDDQVQVLDVPPPPPAPVRGQQNGQSRGENHGKTMENAPSMEKTMENDGKTMEHDRKWWNVTPKTWTKTRRNNGMGLFSRGLDVVRTHEGDFFWGTLISWPAKKCQQICGPRSRTGYDLCFFFNQSWLVVWNIFIFSIQLGIMIPTDEVIFFRGVGSNHQPESHLVTSEVGHWQVCLPIPDSMPGSPVDHACQMPDAAHFLSWPQVIRNVTESWKYMMEI